MIRRHPLPALFASSLLLVVGSLIALRAQPPDFDLLIAGGRIVDGSGAPWFYADVGIKGDRIAAIGQLKAATATTRVDAAGLVVAPGFIDMLGQSEFNVLVDGRAASKVTMGVTTEVTGEGASIAPVSDQMMADSRRAPWQHFGIVQDFRTLGGYFERLETRSRPAINMASFVGAVGVRDYVMGQDERPAAPGFALPYCVAPLDRRQTTDDRPLTTDHRPTR